MIEKHKAQSLTLLQDGMLVGLAASFNTLDLGGDVLVKGAFAPAIDGFLRRGFISLSHQWNRLPIGLPTSAIETNRGLVVGMKLHSTPEAESAIKVIKDRLSAGFSVGLSIGFSPDLASIKAFRTGRALALAWEKLGLAGLPDPQLGDWEGPCRVIEKVTALYEVSIVCVPMNPHAELLGQQNKSKSL